MSRCSTRACNCRLGHPRFEIAHVIPMGLMQSAGEVGTSSYRMLAPLHGRVQYFGFANTLAPAVALHFLPRLHGVPVTSERT